MSFLLINSHQQRRLDRIYQEPIYLIDIELDQHHKCCFKICGSTRNVYDVKLQPSGELTCNCPDLINCRRHGCICKHACFVLIKVLKLPSLNGYYLNNKRLSQDQVTCARQLVESKDTLIDNKELADKYMLQQNISFMTCQDTFAMDDDCSICFNNLGAENECKSCPRCKHHFHTMCIEKWLDVSVHSNCVYCRSDVWKNYNINSSIKFMKLI